jgi:branched-chain amino acid transport system substrate-binding protein
VLSSPDAAYTDSSLPAAKAFLDALDKYAPGLQSGPQFGYDTLFPWLSGKLFEAAATAGHLTPSSTPADVKKGLYALKNETLGGLAPPLTYTPGKPGFPVCYFGMKIGGGALQPLNGDKPICLTQQQAGALASALGKK